MFFLKKISALFLLVVLLYSSSGYYITLYWLHQQKTIAFQKKIDVMQWDESSLITFSFPLDLPYYNDMQEFERYDGSVDVNGVTYVFVKRKIEKGQLILKCLPTNLTQKTIKEVSNWFVHLNGVQPAKTASQKSAQFQIKMVAFEFEVPKKIAIQPLLSTPTQPAFFKANFYQYTCYSTPWQPPKIFA